MSEISIDIDVLFNSLKGRFLILLDSDGIIVKANKDAVLICSNKHKDPVGKTWDNTFKNLGLKNYSFSKLAKNKSIPINVNFNVNGHTEFYELKIDEIILSKGKKDKFLLISGRKQTSTDVGEILDSLKAKDRKLREIINTIPHPIFYKDRKGKYEGFNQAFREVANHNDDEIIGKYTIDSARPIHTKIDRELLQKAQKITYETKWKLDSGETRTYLMTKSTIVDEEGNIEGLVGAAVDVTNIKEAEIELKKSEERYRTLFSTANDAIFIMNEDIFIDCNETTLAMFECKREEIIGHPPYEYSPKYQPDGKLSKESALKKINDALSGSKQYFPWRHTKKSGIEFDAEVSLNTFYIGEELFIQAIVRDVTDKFQLTRNMKIQNERMEEMYKYISSPDISFNEQISRLLELATNSLGFEIGLVSRISNNQFTILNKYDKNSQLDHNVEYSLADTYCNITFENERLIAIQDVESTEYKNHPAYKKHKKQAYIGTPYWVKGNNYGTVAFLSEKPTRKFQPIDLDYVQMLAQWIGATIERVQFEENLLEKDALMETMLRELPIDFSVRDSNLDMVIQSDISKQHWGNNEGKSIDYSDIDKESRIKWKDVFKRALNGEVIKGEDHVKIYGKPYIFYSIVSPVKVKDKVTEVVTINLDISKLKETEEKLKSQNLQLTKLNTELDRFVYSASHDLRAPLASLLGLIDLAGREHNTDATKQYLGLMSKSINTLDTFISNITEYSRNIRLETKAAKINFKSLIKESFDHIQFMIPGPATYDLDIKGNSDFYSDPDRITMILNNLISNSIRYKSYDKDPLIQFFVEQDDKNATFKIVDNGIGIAKNHLDHVFDMFYRANEHKAGSGLGLYIVKETIDKLEGNISIKSEINKGTSITIKLPNMVDRSVTIPK